MTVKPSIRPLDTAMTAARVGAAVHWLWPDKKAPIESNWSERRPATADELTQQWSHGLEVTPKGRAPFQYVPAKQGANVGLRPGIHSEIGPGVYLYVLDVDLRGGEESEALAAVRRYLGPKWENYPRVKTGSGGYHFYFTSHNPLRSKLLERGDGWEVELYGTGKNICLPPSTHPKTGRQYIWAANEPWEAFDLGVDFPLPDESVLNAPGEKAERPTRNFENDVAPADLQGWTIKDYLDQVPNEDRHYDEWLAVGAALHHQFDGDLEGLNLWEEWSAQSPKHSDREYLERKWESFAVNQNGRKPVTFRTVIDMAGGPLAPKQPVLGLNDHLASARAFVTAHYTREGYRSLHHRAGDWFVWRGTHYDVVSTDEIKGALWGYLDAAKRWQKAGSGKDSELELVPFQPNKTRVSNVLEPLATNIALLTDDHQPPCWLDGRKAPTPTSVVPLGNGLLEVERRTLHPHSPAFLSTYSLPFDYEPSRPTPARWLAFLNDLWPDDSEAISTLQEIFGYLLTPDTSHQKIFLLVGPKRSGKGTINRVLTALLGQKNVVSPTLTSLSRDFGLQPLIGKLAATVSDARLGGRTDKSLIAERLLSISGQDAQTINRKYLEPWTGTLHTRFLVFTNELPRIADASGALASRFIVLQMHKSFFGREDRGLAGRLLEELPGILNWALEGWERLQRRGYFVQPQSAQKAIDDLTDLSSPISAFVRDCCTLDPKSRTVTADLHLAWIWYCSEHGHKCTDVSVFGRDLRTAFPEISKTQPRIDGKRRNALQGIALNPGMNLQEISTE